METRLLGERGLEVRDLLPDDECRRDFVAFPDGRRGRQNMDGPAPGSSDRDRDVELLNAGQGPGRGLLLRCERSAVGVAVAEDRDDIGGGAPGERPAGEGLGQVVRDRDPAVGAVEECRLPDGSER